MPDRPRTIPQKRMAPLVVLHGQAHPSFRLVETEISDGAVHYTGLADPLRRNSRTIPARKLTLGTRCM
jgi:hypothetical protein